MSATTYTPGTEIDSTKDTSGIGGHPAGLTTLFFTEMWERFGFYGMRALLVLYMVAGINEGGLGFDNARAASIYGAAMGSVYVTPLFGGWIADRFLGARRAVLYGGIIIAIGYFGLGIPAAHAFFPSLILIALGTGLLKANISTMVGSLYNESDPRRDAGFSIFYMGINLGAMLSPLVCGFLAQHEWFKAQLAKWGMNPANSWHWGFAAAGVGMTLGLVQYLYHRKRLVNVGVKPERKVKTSEKSSDLALEPLSMAGTIAAVIVSSLIIVPFTMVVGPAAFKTYMFITIPIEVLLLSLLWSMLRKTTREERKRLWVVGILFFFSALFWMAFEQAGSSMNLFAEDLTRKSVFGFQFPASWFQSVNSIFIIALAPLFSMLWLRLGRHEPSSPAKFSFGLLFVGLGFIVLAYASTLTGSGQVSPMWLVIVYFLHTIGELCLSPVGLSTVTKLAPARMVGLMMGLWFLSIAAGNYAGGYVAGFFQVQPDVLARLFGYVAIGTIAGALILAALVPFTRKLMAHKA